MAIQKSKTLPNGATGNYWKITRESFNKVDLSCAYEISLFTSKNISDNAGISLGYSKLFKATATKEQLDGDRTELGYNIIKEKAIETNDVDLVDGIDV
jgi:hypothetical protein